MRGLGRGSEVLLQTTARFSPACGVSAALILVCCIGDDGMGDGMNG